MFEEIFQDPTSWPSVILMSSGGNIGFRGDYDLQKFISSLPPAWEGTLFLTDGTFSAMHSGRGSIYDYAEYRRKLRSLTSNMFDRRVQWLDGLGISRDMRMYSEDGPDHVSRSQHFHSQCNEPFTVGLEYREKRMRVCSNITEVVAQLLINFALGPKDRFVEKVERLGIKPAGEAKMMYCHACPADLLPCKSCVLVSLSNRHELILYFSSHHTISRHDLRYWGSCRENSYRSKQWRVPNVSS